MNKRSSCDIISPYFCCCRFSLYPRHPVHPCPPPPTHPPKKREIPCPTHLPANASLVKLGYENQILDPVSKRKKKLTCLLVSVWPYVPFGLSSFPVGCWSVCVGLRSDGGGGKQGQRTCFQSTESVKTDFKKKYKQIKKKSNYHGVIRYR